MTPSIGFKHSLETKNRLREARMKQTDPRLGTHHSEATKQKFSVIRKGKHSSPLSEFKKGMIPWNKGKRLHYQVWNKGKKGVMPIPWNKGKPHLRVRGNNHPNWKGGITEINQKIRHSIEYKIWRQAVFERDDFKCQSCGEKSGELEADHIKPFSLYPELRFEVSNGWTLCKHCHKIQGWRGSHVR